MKTRDVIKAIKADGWSEVSQKGSHQQYKHETKKGRVTIVAGKSGKDIPAGTLRSIEKQSGLSFSTNNKKKPKVQKGMKL